MPRTAWLTRSGRHARHLTGGPTEFLYGYADLVIESNRVVLFEESELGIVSWSRLADAVSARIGAQIGLNPRLTYQAGCALLTTLADFDTLVCTTHSLGLAFSAAKQVLRTHHNIIVLTMGLMEPEATAWRRAVYARVLRGATLAVLSRAEAEWLRIAMPSEVAIENFVFGPDLDFWTPGTDPGADGGVLSVGNDRARDFATLIAAWRDEFPPLTIVTSLPVPTRQPNIHVVRGDWRQMIFSDLEIREKIRRAKVVVVPIRETIQPSGQSFALQAMACARPVVLTANRGLWDVDQLRRHDACRFVPPGTPAAISDEVKALLADPVSAEAMGLRARRMLESEDVSSSGMARQIKAIIHKASSRA